MKYIIDRFEEEIAVCEDEKKQMIDIARNLLPNDCKAGDVIEEINGEWQINQEATSQREATIQELMDDLWE